MMELPDIQKTVDTRGIAIDEVGVSHIRYPIEVKRRSGDLFRTVASIAMTVDLAHSVTGTHMSRFMQSLNERSPGHLCPSNAHHVLKALIQSLGSSSANISMTFPLFIERAAPVSGRTGLHDFDCLFRARLVLDSGGEYTYFSEVGVRCNAASLCPCSKEISDYGAHNQRSTITITTEPLVGSPRVWFEDLVEVAERAASCALYPILKRPDERYVTMRAFDNPVFVEDIVREVCRELRVLVPNTIRGFRVSSINQESIHNHNACARISVGSFQMPPYWV